MCLSFLRFSLSFPFLHFIRAKENLRLPFLICWLALHYRVAGLLSIYLFKNNIGESLLRIFQLKRTVSWAACYKDQNMKSLLFQRPQCRFLNLGKGIFEISFDKLEVLWFRLMLFYQAYILLLLFSFSFYCFYPYQLIACALPHLYYTAALLLHFIRNQFCIFEFLLTLYSFSNVCSEII